MHSSQDQIALPPVPDTDGAAAVERYKAELEFTKAPALKASEETKAIREAEIALNQSFIEGTIEVAKGAIDRAQGGAKVVQSAAAAIGVIYTGVLGLSFADNGTRLPPRGVIAAVFLASALILSTVYLAYLSRSKDTVEVPEPDPDDLRKTSLGLANAFVQWNRFGAFERRYWVRASVVMLGFAILFLPAAFISFSEDEATGANPTASKTDWPTPSASIADPKLAAILFKAEVAEVAAQRTRNAEPKATDDGGHDRGWAIAGVIAFLLALVSPWAIGRIVEDDSDKPSGNDEPQAGEGELIAPMAVQ